MPVGLPAPPSDTADMSELAWKGEEMLKSLELIDKGDWTAIEPALSALMASTWAAE